MEWNKDKSIVLSQACVALFALCLLVLDVTARLIAAEYVQRLARPWQVGAALLILTYAGSVFGWICLYQLWKLLRNIKCGEVFIQANVKAMRIVSWCCVAVSFLCAVSQLCYPLFRLTLSLPLGFICVAAGFMALIVRIVKNAFEQAIAMKSELDLTV